VARRNPEFRKLLESLRALGEQEMFVRFNQSEIRKETFPTQPIFQLYIFQVAAEA
jgi:hypothetical protein